MRKIKFRGKRIDNGEWVYGYYYHDQRFKNGYSCQDVYIIRDKLDQDFEVDPATVGQFTGLKDKNSKKIYKDDVCKYWMDSVWKHGYVFWNQGGFALKVFRMGVKTVDVVFKFQTFIPVPDDGEIMTDQFEVIGNIHDNPDLISER